jgi:hypothetical protein
MNLKRIARLGLLPLFVSALVSCAEERPPITRVQHNALDKHFFVGAKLADGADDPEFYRRNYVVDGSASQSLIGVGSWSGVDRIRWEITEDLLIARKAYIARRYGAEIIDGKSVDRSIASRMLEHANQRLMASYQIVKDARGDPLFDGYGAPILVVDGSGQPVPLDPDLSEIGSLTRYIGLLDAARQIGHKLGYGQLGGGGDDE